MIGIQKHFLVFILLALGCSRFYGQNINLAAESCDLPHFVAQIDSIDNFTTDVQLVGSLNFLADFIQQLEIHNLDKCEVYFNALLLEAKAYCLDYKFDKSLSLFQELILKSKDTKFYALQATAYIQLELVYEFIENWEQARNSIRKAELLIKQHNLETVKPLYYVRLSCLTKFTGSKKDAIKYAHECINHSILQKDRETERGAYMMIAGLSDDKRINIEYHRKAGQIYADFNDFTGQCYMYLNMTRAATLQTEEGRAYFDTVTTLVSKIPRKDNNYFNIMRTYYGLLENDFEQKNQIDSAYHYAKLSFEAEKNAAITRNREGIELDDMQTDLFLTQDLLKDIERNQKWLLRIVVIGIVTLGLLGLLVLLLYKSRRKVLKQSLEIKKKNEILQVYNDENALLLSEIHHRVKNNLHNIIGLIHLKQGTQNSDENTLILDDITSKIYSMSLMHEQLYNEGDFSTVDLNNYMTELIAKFQNITEGLRDVKFNLTIEKVKLNLETTMPVGIIITELITNSLKHNAQSDKLIIDIKLRSASNIYTLDYLDTGAGLKEEILQEGTGLTLVRGLVRQLKGAIEIQGIKGYAVRINFKEKLISKI